MPFLMPSLVIKLSILCLYFFMPTALSWFWDESLIDQVMPWYSFHSFWLGMIALTYLVVFWGSQDDA
jgi:hypothetical protein